MSKYNVSDEKNCKVIRGLLQISEMPSLIHSWVEGRSEMEWKVDSKLSLHLGVAMVCGTKEALKAWRSELGI